MLNTVRATSQRASAMIGIDTKKVNTGLTILG
jgi:hypothetical protein